MSNELILNVRELSVVKGGRQIINIPELSVVRGQFVAVTGPNGAGKSTLLKALGFLEPSYQGEIVFLGYRVCSEAEKLRTRRRMAMVFQDPLLLKGSVRYNMTIGLKLRGIDAGIIASRVNYWLEKLRISSLADRDVRTLSGGEAQRVNLARALALEPDILFLDEPFTYLDMPTKASIVSELKDIVSETQTATFMVTHDLTDIPYLADWMLVMLNGLIVQSGPPEEVLNCPSSQVVARFLGMENLWAGEMVATGQGLYLVAMGEGVHPLAVNGSGLGQDEVPLPARVLTCIRPEHVMVLEEDSKSAGRLLSNVYDGEVAAVCPMGYYYRIEVSTPGFAVTAITSADRFGKPPKRGDVVTVYLPPERVHPIFEGD